MRKAIEALSIVAVVFVLFSVSVSALGGSRDLFDFRLDSDSCCPFFALQYETQSDFSANDMSGINYDEFLTCCELSPGTGCCAYISKTIVPTGIISEGQLNITRDFATLRNFSGSIFKPPKM